MDHDTHEPRISKLERFLDIAAPGWRDEKNWDEMRRNHRSGLDAAPGELVRDDEQTKRDREALGLTDDVELRGGRRFLAPGSGKNPGVDDGKDAELRDNARAGKGAVNDEQAAKNDRSDAGTGSDLNPATQVALEGARSNPATEQALQTEQNPVRQERAKDQQDQKAAVESR